MCSRDLAAPLSLLPTLVEGSKGSCTGLANAVKEMSINVTPYFVNCRRYRPWHKTGFFIASGVAVAAMTMANIVELDAGTTAFESTHDFGNCAVFCVIVRRLITVDIRW